MRSLHQGYKWRSRLTIAENISFIVDLVNICLLSSDSCEHFCPAWDLTASSFLYSCIFF